MLHICNWEQYWSSHLSFDKKPTQNCTFVSWKKKLNIPLGRKKTFHSKINKSELTTHAACTASDTLPALGSHQKTWHWKCWFPVSIMKANVCTSRPTPMKDKKRTRHSTSASSSSSCRDSHGSDLDFKLFSIRSSSQKLIFTLFINLIFLRTTTRSCLPFLWWQPGWCQQYSV